MKEYKTISVKPIVRWGGFRATESVDVLDEALNKMARDGWELVCIQGLHHGTLLLCIFSREAQP